MHRVGHERGRAARSSGGVTGRKTSWSTPLSATRISSSGTPISSNVSRSEYATTTFGTGARRVESTRSFGPPQTS